MWTILVSLFAGTALSLLKIIPEKFMKYNLRIQQIGVIILLFSMGASIGSNKELLGNLKMMGIKAATFAVLTTAFSVLLTYLFTRKFMGEVNEK